MQAPSYSNGNANLRSTDLPPSSPPRLSVCQSPERRDDTLIEELVQELSRMQRARTLSLLLDVGALVVDRLFQGDLAKIRSRARKDKSLRKLAAHPKLPFSAATLWRAIAIYELVRRFPGLVEVKNLSVSHMRVVVGLPPHVQEKLLRLAETEKWSSERLESEADKYRGLAKCRSGRPRLPELVKAASRIERIVESAATPDDTTVRCLNDQQRECIRLAVANLRTWCRDLEQLLSDDAPFAAAG